MPERILSPGEAMRLGDLLTAISAKKCIKYIDKYGNAQDGELRSLVVGESLGMLPFGTDVRDAYVWITNPPLEMAVSVAHLIEMYDEGGVAFT